MTRIWYFGSLLKKFSPGDQQSSALCCFVKALERLQAAYASEYNALNLRKVRSGLHLRLHVFDPCEMQKRICHVPLLVDLNPGTTCFEVI